MNYPVNKEKHFISSLFGPRSFVFNGVVVNDFHNGVDFAPKSGQPEEVYSVAPGFVEYTGFSPYFWFAGKRVRNTVIIINHHNYKTEYLHCVKILVNVGDSVKTGDIIGYSGSEGAAVGIHLHFGLSINGKYVDPLPYLNGSIKLPGTGTETTHIVKPGETLSSIAALYGITLNDIIAFNQDIKNPNLIHPGQKINIPKKEEGAKFHVVQKGETLAGIAKKYGTDWQSLARKNNLINPNLIFPGQKIII